MAGPGLLDAIGSLFAQAGKADPSNGNAVLRNYQRSAQPPLAAQTPQQQQDAATRASQQQAAKVVDAALTAAGKQVDAGTRQQYVDAVAQGLTLGVTAADAQKELTAAVQGVTPEQLTSQKQTQAVGLFDTIRKQNAPGGGGTQPATPPTTPGGAPDPLTGLEAAASAYATTMPKPSDYPSTADYQAAISAWNSDYTEILKNLQTARELKNGVVKLGDGTIIDQGVYDGLGAVGKAQVDQWRQQQANDLVTAYDKTLNDLGLTEWTSQNKAITDENDVRKANFANQVTAATTKIAYDRQNASNAADAITRATNGMAESRQRSDAVTKNLLAAAPLATGGKTSFTGADFGGLLDTLGQQAGTPSGQPLLRIPQTVHIDPSGLLAQYDQQAGVSGPIPTMPAMVTTPSDVALTPPTLLDVPQGGPTLIKPPPPVPLPPILRPGSTAGSDPSMGGLLDPYDQSVMAH